VTDPAPVNQIEDLKNYFEAPDEEEEEAEDPFDSVGTPDLLLGTRAMPRSKDELLALLPEKTVIERLMNRYFNSNTPSQRECTRANPRLLVYTSADKGTRYYTSANLWEGVPSVLPESNRSIIAVDRATLHGAKSRSVLLVLSGAA
jgi:hypothetical protein